MTKQGRLIIDVSMAAARQGAGGGDRCLSGGYLSSVSQMTRRKRPTGAQTVRVALDTPFHRTDRLPLPLTSEVCIGLKYCLSTYW